MLLVLVWIFDGSVFLLKKELHARRQVTMAMHWENNKAAVAITKCRPVPSAKIYRELQFNIQ